MSKNKKKTVAEEEISTRVMNGLTKLLHIITYYIDTDEIPGFFLLLKNHTFIAHSEQTIFLFHI